MNQTRAPLQTMDPADIERRMRALDNGRLSRVVRTNDYRAAVSRTHRHGESAHLASRGAPADWVGSARAPTCDLAGVALDVARIKEILELIATDKREDAHVWVPPVPFQPPVSDATELPKRPRAEEPLRISNVMELPRGPRPEAPLTLATEQPRGRRAKTLAQFERELRGVIGKDAFASR